MNHYLAFLRGINLGKRRLSMEALRTHFEKLKFSDVATFIASGNVIFSSKQADVHKLEQQIETHLASCLGYEVETFVRTRAEVAGAAAFPAFGAGEPSSANTTIHVGFLKESVDQPTARAIRAIATATDEFSVNGREIYWLCRIKTNESKIWTSAEMKAVKLPRVTMRNLTTVRKLAALYPVKTDR